MNCLDALSILIIVNRISIIKNNFAIGDIIRLVIRIIWEVVGKLNRTIFQ